MFKIVNRLAPAYLHDMIKGDTAVTAYNLRNSSWNPA